MTLQTIANALVEACRNGQERALLDTHYHPDAISVEAQDYSGMGRETVGLDGIHGKHDWWEATFDIISSKVTGPFLHGDDRFGVIFEVDAVETSTGEAMPMQELALYHVADGKIVREEFFGIT